MRPKKVEIHIQVILIINVNRQLILIVGMHRMNVGQLSHQFFRAWAVRRNGFKQVQRLVCEKIDRLFTVRFFNTRFF